MLQILYADYCMLLMNIAASLIVGSLLGLGLALWLSRRTLNHELKPLDELRHAITHRNPDHLKAIELPSPRVELAPVVSELNHLLDRVTTSIERERRFLADAAHELRTPLNHINGFGEMMAGCTQVAGGECH